MVWVVLFFVWVLPALFGAWLASRNGSRYGCLWFLALLIIWPVYFFWKLGEGDKKRRRY